MASRANDPDRRRIGWRVVGWAIPVGLLTMPLLAGWPWSGSDFVAAAAMFGIVGGSFELAVRASGSRAYRFGAAAALATAFLLVWINLAVGIIGNENNPLNLMFFGVTGIALVGSIVARFRAAGMALAMTLAAALQAMIGFGVFVSGAAAGDPPGAVELLVLILVFAGAWLVSAWCFYSAAREQWKML